MSHLKNQSISIGIVVYDTDPKIFTETLEHVVEAGNFLKKTAPTASIYVDIINTQQNPKWQLQVKELSEKIFESAHCEMHYIAATSNLGMGQGNNIAIRRSQANYHLILNPDVLLSPSSLVDAITFLEDHPKIGLIGPRINDPDGELFYSCRKNPTLFDLFLRCFAPNFIKKIFKKRLDSIEMRDKNYTEVMYDISFLSGCCLFARTSVLKTVGGFDPRYFLYVEDADLTRSCLNIMGTAYVPAIKVMHYWARGSYKKWGLKLTHIRSAFNYFLKWGGLF